MKPCMERIRDRDIAEANYTICPGCVQLRTLGLPLPPNRRLESGWPGGAASAASTMQFKDTEIRCASRNTDAKCFQCFAASEQRVL